MYYLLLRSVLLEFDKYQTIYIFSAFLYKISTSEELYSHTNGSTPCLCLSHTTNAMYIQYLTHVILSPVQNTVRIHKCIIILNVYYVGSRLVTLPEFIHASIHISDTFVLTVFKLINFSFRYSLFLFLKVLQGSCLTLFRLSPFI
jgi:hypothetical protein